MWAFSGRIGKCSCWLAITGVVCSEQRSSHLSCGGSSWRVCRNPVLGPTCRGPAYAGWMLLLFEGSSGSKGRGSLHKARFCHGWCIRFKCMANFD